MFIVLTLVLMGCIEHIGIRSLFLCLVCVTIAKKYTIQEAFKTLIIGLLFMISLSFNFPQLGHNFRVIEVRDSWYILQNGMNKYYYSSSESLEYDAVYAIEGSITPLDSKSKFHVINRYQGILVGDQVRKVKPMRLVHRFILKIYGDFPVLMDFIYKDSRHIFVSLALHFYAIERLLYWGTRRFVTKEKRLKIYQGIIGVYGIYFGFNLNCFRHFMKGFNLKKETHILIILFLFPYAQFHLGFIVAYFPQLMHAILGLINRRSFDVARIFLIHTLTGSVHILQMMLFKVWIHIVALVYFLMIIQQNSLASSVLSGYSVFLNKTSRFEFRGGIPILVFIGSLFIISNTKKFTLAYLSIVLMSAMFPFPRVLFVNVGQGDAIIITTAFNAHVTLIDTGRIFALSNLEEALKSLGVRQIDQLIITHDDLDHNENMDYLIHHYQVNKLITQKNSSVVFLTELLDDVIYEESNENSLIFTLQTKRLSFLFTGDAYIQQEKQLIQRYPHLAIDVLKLGHHGSRTSTSEAFIKTLQPRYAIASSNPNIYNHPHPEVMHLLHQFRVSLLKTSDYGNITFIMSTLFDFVVSQRGHFGIIETR